MGSFVVTPKSSEEQDFLLNLFQRLGIVMRPLAETEEAEFLSEYELSESGIAFLEERVQVALGNPKPLKTWQQVSGEASAKHNWPTN